MLVLVAVDSSEASMTAVRAVLARPWPPSSTFRVLSVVESLMPLAPEVAAMTLDLEQLMQSRTREAQQLVDRVASTLRGTGATVETIVRDGDPRTEIVDEAAKCHADLVVLGSHGRTGLKRLMIGSVAEYVVRHAGCSVEIARDR
jgi:universal stress protein A